MKVAVSYLSNRNKAAEAIKKIDASSADYIHVDLIDGKFVGEKNFTISKEITLLNNVIKPLDIHLMTLKPEKYFMDLAMLNTEYITFHVEAVKNPGSTINNLKELGIKAGIAINPDTDLSTVKDYLGNVDQILVMGVNPGLGGQEFITDILSKIDELINLKNEFNYTFIISVDGGINDETIKLLKEKDIDMVVSGSFVCKSNNLDEQIIKLK